MIEPVYRLMQFTVFNNTIQSYALGVLVFLGVFLALSMTKRILVHYLKRIAGRTASDFDDFLVGLIQQVGGLVMAAVSLHLAASTLALSEGISLALRYVVVFVVTVRVVLICQAIIQYALRKIMSRRMSASASSVPLVNGLSFVVRWAVWVLGAVFILSNLGVNVSSLIAGIGIGGIAVAMASQAVLGDAFSAVCIYLDRPFEIGDFIIIDDKMGTVEHIGIKTTRIRSLSGEQLVFCNSDMTKSRISNYKRMQHRRVVFKLSVVLETPVDKVERIPQMITALLKGNDVGVERVHLQSLGDYALIYEIVYHVRSADYNVYMDKQQAINLAILRTFERERIELAYPTKVVYDPKA